MAGPRAELDVERLVLERQIRNHVRRAPAGDTRADVPLAASLRLLGDRALLEYANLDGALYAVSVIDNRATLHELGPVDGLADDVDSCVHGLHRLNRVQGSAASRAAAADDARRRRRRRWPSACSRRACARSGRPLVIVPTGVLHGLPWAVLPGLQGRPVSVTPSLTGWAIAHRRDEKVERVALVAGPGLRHAADEIAALALLHPGADVLVGRAATADRVPAGVRPQRPHPHRLPRLVPPGQPAVLDAPAGRRVADGVRPRAQPGDAPHGRALGLQRRHGDVAERRHRSSGWPAR